ncbi:hypothetical protein GGR58DRAFT_518630 [Xylaria digitata]|nr:hypothetical protein GGR58DRAFT_518630 [Xylaria digitata]
MASFLKGVPYEMRVSRLIRLLRMPRQPKLIPTADGHGDMDRNHERHDDSVIGQPFSSRWMTPELVVGQRTYKLHLLFHLLLSDTLVLPYVDSSCVLRPRFPVRRRRDLTRPFEPFIAAVLISRAQSLSPPSLGKEGGGQSGPNGAVEKSVMDSLITVRTTTQLLFTHRDDQQDIHVYTALISRALLDRFRYPNQPPATTAADIQNHFMDPLIRLDHRRVPYEPRVTFRQRLLAAVSITPIIKSNLEGDTGCRKRALSPDGRVYTVSPKRPRRPECPRNPLSSLDLNLEGHLHPP